MLIAVRQELQRLQIANTIHASIKPTNNASLRTFRPNPPADLSTVPDGLFVTFAAPEALCPDRRWRTLSLYLASPLDRMTYVLAKAIAIVAVVHAAEVGHSGHAGHAAHHPAFESTAAEHP